MQNEIMQNEINKYAEIIGITVDEATAVFNGIVTDNNLDINTEDGLKIARSIFRSRFGQMRARIKNEKESEVEEFTSNRTQKVTGFFWAIDNPTNWGERNRNSLMAEYQRDAQACINSGKIVLAVQLSDGRFEMTTYRDDELKTKVMEILPDNEPMQVDDDRWIIPVDHRKAWPDGNPNKNYGAPLPANRWSNTLYFVGKLENGEYANYQLKLTDETAKTFVPNTFGWCELDVIPNSNNPNFLNAKRDGTTVSSLKYLDEGDNMLEVLQNVLGDKCTELSTLDSYHSDNSHKPYAQRLVITDGNVASMRLEPNANGTRVLNLSDLNADFDYDGDGYSSTTCWIPESIDIDFGIGSNVIVSGRTSQGTDTDGNLRPVSINTLGLFVVDRHGTADVFEPTEEGNGDWFNWE